MNEAETFLKLAVLFLLLTVAVFLPLKINFSRNYFIAYVAAVLFFVHFYSSVFLGFRIDSAFNNARYALAGIPDFNSSVEVFEERRVQLIERLTQLGISKDKILKTIEPLNNKIIELQATRVYRSIQKEIRALSKSGESVEKAQTEVVPDWRENFRLNPKSLMSTEGIDEMIKDLKENNAYTEKIGLELNRLKKFIMNFRFGDLDGKQ